jgi:hypothetical protein
MMMSNSKKMTKADLIKALADVADDATIYFETRDNGFNVKKIRHCNTQKCLWIDLDYDIDFGNDNADPADEFLHY